MTYVSVGKRAAAVLIDGIVFFVLGWVIALFTGNTTANGFGFSLSDGPAFLLFFVSFAYFTVMEATLGATVGKLALRLRVVREDGTPIDWQASLIRNILRIIDGLFFYLVGAILVWTSPTRQRLGDRVAGTVVTQRAGVQAT
jgi:uncharacterized RDD family membrane protein YckC